MTNKALTAGFTLIETLIAVTVLMIAIAGPLTIAAKGMQSTLIAKDQDTAFYLAQDAVEYVRWVRDTNRLSGGNWITGAGATLPANVKDLTPCQSAGGCRIDSIGNTIVNCTTTDPGGVCIPINYSQTNNYFTYNAVDGVNIFPTIFTRTVTLTSPVGNTDEQTLTVKVSWCDQATACSTTPRSVTVREDIFNWQ